MNAEFCSLVPLSILLGLGISTLLYLLANVAYLVVLSNGGVAQSERVAADMMERLFRSIGGSLISLAVLISVFGTINANILAGPRLWYAMAKQRMFFQWVTRVHPTYRTPDAAILVLTVTSALQILLLGYWETIVTSQAATLWVFQLMGGLSVVILRRTPPRRPPAIPDMGVPDHPRAVPPHRLGVPHRHYRHQPGRHVTRDWYHRTRFPRVLALGAPTAIRKDTYAQLLLL